MVRLHFVYPGAAELRKTDYEPILTRIAAFSPKQSAQRLNNTCTGMAVVDHGNPGARPGTPTTATVDAEVFLGLIGALEFYSWILDVRCVTSLNPKPHLHLPLSTE